MDLELGSERLVVLGSLNANPQDRTLSRDIVVPVQYFDGNSWKPMDYFSKIGELGISSFGIHSKSNKLFFSTGQEIFILNVDSGSLGKLEVDRVKDVHEISVDGDSIWVANTGTDEALEINAITNKLENRISLKDNSNGDSDKFHMNQIFFNHEGSSLCLVHHVRGKQFLKQVKGRILKQQGDGGLINLMSKEITGLQLRAPHSVLSVRDEYWVMNSGNQEINIYDHSWNLKEKLPTVGWGRGAEISFDGIFVFVGISPIRRRYAGLIKESTTTEPVVQVFHSVSRESIMMIPISGIEQINNLYLIDNGLISAIRSFE